MAQATTSFACMGRKTNFPSWLRSPFNKRQINRRETEVQKHVYFLYTWEEPEKLSNSQKWPKPSLKYHLQLKTEEDIGMFERLRGWDGGQASCGRLSGEAQ